MNAIQMIKRSGVQLALVVLTLIACNSNARNSALEVDMSFHPFIGAAETYYYPPVNAIAVQADGRIVIGGTFTNVNGLASEDLVRLLPDGSLDTSFQWMAPWFYPQVILAQPDGRILVGGTGRDTLHQYTGLIRLLSDGSLDPSFQFYATQREDYMWTRALALQPDGRILISYNRNDSNIVTRINANGSQDPTFQTLRMYQLDDDSVEAIALQSDGKILIGGYLLAYDSALVSRHLARLNADGSVDTGFAPEIDSSANRVAIQPDGRVVISGWFTTVDGVPCNGVARLNADGRLDPTFNRDISPGNRINATVLSLLSDGRMLVGGSRFPTNTTSTDYSHFLALVNPQGISDPDSTVTFDVNASQWHSLTEMAIQANGQILVGGRFNAVNGTPRTNLVRLNRVAPPTGPGSVDLTFDPTAGRTMIGLAGDKATVNCVTTQTDGKLMIAGRFIGINGVPARGIARLNSQGQLDRSFNPGLGPLGQILQIIEQPDRRLLLVGSFIQFDGHARPGLARVNADGSLDMGFAPVIDPPGNMECAALQTDGCIVIGGHFTNVQGVARKAVARLHPDGKLDPSFDAATVTTFVDAWVRTLAIQPDGRILMAGPFAGYDQPLARLNPDGRADESLTVPIIHPGPNQIFGWVYSLCVEANGAILLGGEFDSINGVARRGVARLLEDGSLDETFTPSLIGSEYYRTVTKVVVQPDGKTLIGGTFNFVAGAPRHGLARLQDDGSFDASFDPQLPIPATPWQTPEHFRDMALLPDGRLMVSIDGFYSWTEGCLVLLDADGAPDASYVEPRIPAAGSAPWILPQPDGKTMIVGDNWTDFNNQCRYQVARINRDGTLDGSFESELGPESYVHCATRQRDGKVLVAGELHPLTDQYRQMGIVRLLPDGPFDPSFQILDHTEMDNPYLPALLVQADGKILVGGQFMRLREVAKTNVARLHPDGSLDEGFVPTGLIFEGVEDSVVMALAQQPDGKILVGGQFGVTDNIQGSLARLNLDGSLDSNFTPSLIQIGRVQQIHVLPDGKILLCGSFVLDFFSEWTTLVRLHADGTWDETFHSAASRFTAEFVVQPDGKLLVAGNTGYGPPLERLDSDGSVDKTFTADLTLNSDVHPLALQADGQLLVSGTFSVASGFPAYGLVRLNTGLIMPQPFVERQMPGVYQLSGAPIAISLRAQPPEGASVYAVEDRPPAGWLVSGFSPGGAFDARTGKVKFGPFFDAETRLLTYVALPPTNATGTQCFEGVASSDGIDSPVVGPACISPIFKHPADTSAPLFSMSIGEVTAYGAAWRKGQLWPQSPNPIPIDYVTRAAGLWRWGECYTMDPSVKNPPLWWVNCAPAAPQLISAATDSNGNESTADSPMPLLFVPGEPITIRVCISLNRNTQAYAAEDQPPTGWTVSGITSGGEFDAVNHKVKWGPFLDGQPRSLSYNAIPTVEAGNLAAFSGSVSFDGNGFPISGSRQLRASSRLSVHGTDQAGRLAVRIHGQPGVSYRIETSTDLIQWTVLDAVISSTNQVQAIGPTSLDDGKRFYRARPMP